MPLEGGRNASCQMTSRHADDGASSNPVEPAGANAGTREGRRPNSTTPDDAAATPSSSSSCDNDRNSSGHSTQQQQRWQRWWQRKRQRKRVQGRGWQWQRRATAENAATAAACSHGASSATAGNANSTHMAQRHSANARGEEDHARAKRPQQRSVNVHGECPHTWAEQHVSHATRDTSRDAKRPKRPTQRANPPRRRGRLKVQSDSSSDASEMDARCWGSIIGPPGPNLKDSEPATRRPRASHSPMQDAPRLTKSGNRASVALRNALQVIYGYGFYSLVY
ncbi:hypothetical protein BU15DRAFT_69925 [Melanogaster broomeanus]|nr:hypothetical protein BU15DRAFT_69925 [Melanogaster broomeanus]